MEKGGEEMEEGGISWTHSLSVRRGVWRWVLHPPVFRDRACSQALLSARVSIKLSRPTREMNTDVFRDGRAGKILEVLLSPPDCPQRGGRPSGGLVQGRSC